MKAIFSFVLALLALFIAGKAQASRKSSDGFHHTRASADIKAVRTPAPGKGRTKNTKYYRPNHPRISTNPSPKRSPFNIQDWQR